MSRGLQLLALVVALVAVVSPAAAAQATPYWFNSDAAAGKVTTLKGEQVGGGDVFTTTAGTVKCTGINYVGTQIGPTATTMSLAPAYSGCTAFGFAGTVITTGCSFVLHSGEETEGGIFHATATLDCETGKEVTVIAKLAGVTRCTVHIKAQDIGTVTLTNGVKASGKKDIHADINLTNVAYTHTAGTGAGACSSGSATNGSYTGTATVSGYNEGGAETDIALEELPPPTSEPYWFKSDAAAGKVTTLKGEQVGGSNIFGTTAGIWKCPKSSYTGSVVGPTRMSITLHPEYAKCILGGVPLEVITTGCNFILNLLEEKFTATMSLECEAGREITFVSKESGVLKCTIHIKEQDMGTIILTNMTNVSGVKDIYADINLTNVAYTHTGGTGAGACTSGGATNGSYVDEITVRGFNEGGQETNIFFE